MKRANVVLAVALSVLQTGFAFSADDGGRPGAFLDYAASARSLGMGQAFTALADDASAVYFNPSGLALMRRKNVSAQFSTLLEDASIGFVGYAHPLARTGGFGVGVVTLGSGDITRRDNNGNKTGSYDATSTAALLSGANTFFGHRLSLGTTAKIVRQAVADDSDVGFGLDLGALFAVSEKVRLGLAGRNLVSPSFKLAASSEDFPRSFALGVSYKPAEPFTVGLDLEQPESGSLKPRLGADYLFNDILAVRAGVNDNEFAAGLGIGVGDWGFDYALGYSRASSDVRDLGSFHRFGFQFNFGLPVPRAGFPAVDVSAPVPAPAPAVVVVKDKKKKSGKKAAKAAEKPAKAAKPSPAQAALRQLGETMDTWDGRATREVQKQVDLVSRHLRRSHYVKPEDIYAAQGYISFFTGDYPKSARSLERAADILPADEGIAKRLARAKELVDKTEEKTRRDEAPEIRAVRQKYEAKDWAGTILMAQRILETSPKNEEAKSYLSSAISRLVQPRLRQAKELLDSDRYVESFIQFQKVLDYDPENAEATGYSNRVVQIIEKKGDMESAVRSVSRAETTYAQGIALYNKGLRLYGHGDVAGARGAWENALLQVKSSPLLYDVVRSAIAELGRSR